VLPALADAERTFLDVLRKISVNDITAKSGGSRPPTLISSRARKVATG